MVVVAVEFMIHVESVAAFMPLMIENARASRTDEPGCRQFDVCTDRTRPERIFLYELYDHRAAFDAHLATTHFKSFDAATVSMIAAKTVYLMERVAP